MIFEIYSNKFYLQAYDHITTNYNNYWQFFGHWLMFLDINEDGCAEHPDLCSGKIGEPVYLYTVHGKLNPNLTPHGMYRSHQITWYACSI